MKTISLMLVVVLSTSFAMQAAWGQRGGVIVGGVGGFHGGAIAGVIRISPSFQSPRSITSHQPYNLAPSVHSVHTSNPNPSTFRPWRLAKEADARFEGPYVFRSVIRLRERMPTAEQLQVMPRRSLYQWLRIGGDDLRQDLARFGNGEEWAGYFRLDELRETIAEESEIAPYVAHQGKWQRLWRTYVGISEDSKYKRIQRMIGFQLIDSTLAELIKPAERRDRIRLVISARELNQALDSIPNGAGWKRYLALPDEEVKKPELSISEGSIPRNVAKLRMVESRFDSIRNNPKYRALAEWPTFQAAHQNLSTYLDHLVDAQAIPHLAHD